MSRNHIIIIDGTQSKLTAGHETNAGILYKLLDEVRDPKTTSLYYNRGIQGEGLLGWITIASGWGINQDIKEAYDRLSSRYEAGDKIYLFGFSRGAYAVRSVAGMINQLGLLKKGCATSRNLRQAFRMYENRATGQTLDKFRRSVCHQDVDIEMIGVWDTVKALGIDYPILSRLAPMATDFHDDAIGNPVKYGFHAVALDETRTAYKAVLWDTKPDWAGTLEQVWFRGAHSDVGGHVGSFPKARPLSNIPLVWMLERTARCGLKLPKNWRDRFPIDPEAPAVGSLRGISKFFLFRAKRPIGQNPNEYLHHSAFDVFKGKELPVPVQKHVR